MTMKPCKTCGNMVSTNASKCPHCGERNPTVPPFSEMSTGGKIGMSIIYIILAIGFICLFILILAFC